MTIKDRKSTKGGKRLKTTVYLDRDQVIGLEELRMKRLKETGQKITLTELIREAVDNLLDRESS